MKNIFLFLFTSLLYSTAIADLKFSDDFIFGVANAPAQVEDALNDTWMEWARQGKVRTWKQTERPEEKLQFWTKPEIELDLAAQLGAGSFRMGIDWGRIMPQKNQFDEKALAAYADILKKVRQRKMSIMLTLMHHSVPTWVQAQGGWHNEETKKDFLIFAKKIISTFKDKVDYWITFNEANVFVTMAYTVGIWPPGETASPLSLFALGPFRGDSIKALDLMAEAHNEVYTWAHQEVPQIKIGLAHNMAHYTGKSFFNRLKASYVDSVMNWHLPEKVKNNLDFFGFNYYGAEWFKGTQVDIDPEEEYSEAGRAVDVNGLYDLLQEIHHRYEKLPIMITENGTADANDIMRPAYHIEHLAAVYKAIEEKIPVKAYYIWSLTDNFEWSDGYCPKFGLVAVDRKTMTRKKRPSFDVMKNIFQKKLITAKEKDKAWQQVVEHQGEDRPFCRDSDGLTALDVPIMRKYVKKDWRFKP